MNKALILGRLGSDPESREVKGGMLTNFSVATSERWGSKDDGTAKEHTEWHRIVAFGKLAEICTKYLVKGSQVLVEGKIQTRSWDDKDGVKRYSTEIVAASVQFVGDKKTQDDKPQDDDDGIPF